LVAARTAGAGEVPAAGACCAPLTDQVLSERDADDLAAMFRLLADPVRLRLLSMVASAPGGEACACDLTGPLGRSQPTISHHLGALTAAGILEREKRGRWAWFRVVPERLVLLREVLGAPS